MNTRKRSKSKAILTIRVVALLSEAEYRRLMELSNTLNLSAGAVVRQLLNEAK